MKHIEGITINHDSSAYTELLLRSLYDRNPEVEGLNITVMDNSSDDDTQPMMNYADEKGIPVKPTPERYLGYGNSHGEILRDFVLEHLHADYFLFLDTDIAFLEDDTISIMEKQLAAVPDAFGIQALLSHNGIDEQPLGSDYCAPEMLYRSVSRVAEKDRGKIGLPTTAHPLPSRMKHRIHPCCCLVRNSEAFKLVTEIIGFSPAGTLENACGKTFDTFGLMTQVMRTHQLKHIYSTKMVLHFIGATHANTPGKEQLRDRLLNQFRLKQQSDEVLEVE
ncbi:MAG: hypothetical protein GKR89_15695 [Candidatus Latescibacteria bacterium]|nr:hypothetical protein [Candidatus Latescibacterota bacterium]